jgi:hypothetical protein
LRKRRKVTSNGKRWNWRKQPRNCSIALFRARLFASSGAGFITLAATLAVIPTVPIQSLALIVGIDRFMSECRALTNFVGNGVATVVISRWEKEISKEQLRANLSVALPCHSSRYA